MKARPRLPGCQPLALGSAGSRRSWPEVDDRLRVRGDANPMALRLRVPAQPPNVVVLPLHPPGRSRLHSGSLSCLEVDKLNRRMPGDTRAEVKSLVVGPTMDQDRAPGADLIPQHRLAVQAYDACNPGHRLCPPLHGNPDGTGRAFARSASPSRKKPFRWSLSPEIATMN